MARAPFQVLIIPFRRVRGDLAEFAAFRRADDGSMQGVAGGGEDDEKPAEAARREAFEEAGIPASQPLYALETRSSIPTEHFDARRSWPPDLYVIPEYTFAVDCGRLELRLSPEHSDVHWLTYGLAMFQFSPNVSLTTAVTSFSIVEVS